MMNAVYFWTQPKTKLNSSSDWSEIDKCNILKRNYNYKFKRGLIVLDNPFKK